ncbi:F-box protein SKIP23-like isoform X2 [Rhododendron vialii]|nr:F-box protein SKIP23-like isoform X2 [Rhododendron vialii]
MALVLWSELPRDLLKSIGTRLDNRTDVLRFRSVCSSWRNSIPPFRKWPLQRFTLPNGHGSLCLTATTVYRLRPIDTPPDSPPPKPWLVRVSDSRETQLLNPLSDVQIKPPCRPLLVNLSQFRISEIGRSYRVNYVDLADFGILANVEQDWAIHFDKVVFLSDTDGDDAVVVALQSHHHIIGGYLAAIRLREDEFMPIAYSRGNEFHDIIHFNGRIFAVDVYGNCYTVDALLNISLIAPQLNGQVAGKKNLVESSGELIMVERFFNKTWYDEENGVSITEVSGGNEMQSWFRVYKLDEEEHTWVELTNLGDRMLFVGKDCCFSVSGTDFDGFDCRGNCIFFVDEYCMLFDENYHDQYDELRVLGEMEIGVFNLEDSSVGPLVCFPGYADLFWPPPSWLATVPSSTFNPA